QLHRPDLHQLLRTRRDADRVHQRPSKPRKFHLHDIAVTQPDAVAEAERVGAEEMNVDISRPSMRVKFEMMMLDICQAVAHHRLASLQGLGPDLHASAKDCRGSE